MQYKKSKLCIRQTIYKLTTIDFVTTICASRCYLVINLLTTHHQQHPVNATKPVVTNDVSSRLAQALLGL